MPPQDERYERLEGRVRDAVASFAGLGLIIWEATRLAPNRDLIIAGVFLMIAPKARQRVVDLILGGRGGKTDDN